MTHEPHIIREAERVLKAAQVQRRTYTRPLAGLPNPSPLDTPENTVCVAREPWHDYGDMHTPRRTD